MKLLENIINYSKFIKIYHSIFAFPFLIAGIFLAPGWKTLNWKSWAALLFAMVFARCAAMGFNRLIDARIDQKNPRTQNREIPSGKITIFSAKIFVTINSILFILLAYYLNDLAFKTSWILLLILFGYSYTKRFTWLSHFILGFSIGLAPTAGWIAVTGQIDASPLFLSAALMFYISGFDLLYSTQDTEFDRIQGLYSIPAHFGIGTALWTARFCHLLSLAFFYFVGKEFSLNGIYWVGLLIIAILMFIEHYLVKRDDLSKVPMAFFHMNSLISIVVGLAILGGIFVRF